MMAEETITLAALEGWQVLACDHYWVIEPANGPFSQGVCQRCGGVRQFKNFVEGPSWDDLGLITSSRAESLAVTARAVAIYMEGEEE